MCYNKNCNCSSGCGCLTSKLGYWLVIVGAVNWGLVGLGGFFGMELNLVYLIFGFMPMLMNIVYLLVGVSGVMLVVGCPCSKCKNGVCDGCMPKNNSKTENVSTEGTPKS